MCRLTDFFSGKPYTDLEKCNQARTDLASSLANRTDALNASNGLLAREQVKTDSLEAEIRRVNTAHALLVGQYNDQSILLANARQERDSLSLKIELLTTLHSEWTALTPFEKVAEVLTELEPSAEAWYELTELIADYMKVRGVQTVEVSAAEIDKRLKVLFPNATIHRQRDNFYYLPTKAKGLEIIARDWTDLVTYIAEHRDCDDFSEIFSAMMTLFYALNNVFEIWSSSHSFLVVLYSDGEVILEPQTDFTFKVGTQPLPLYEVVEIWP